jgi:hypothetical protein
VHNPAQVGQLIYNYLISSASLFTGRHQSESLDDFTGIRNIALKYQDLTMRELFRKTFRQFLYNLHLFVSRPQNAIKTQGSAEPTVGEA